MTRTAVAAAWPDGSNVTKGTVRSWSAEVDSRVTFNNVAELTAATIVSPGVLVKAVLVLGYLAGGDGGGAEYKYRSSTPTTGGAATSNGGAVNWEISNMIPDAKMFGCVFDAPYGDTVGTAANSTDDIIPMNAFIKFLRAKGRRGTLPAAATYCSDTIYAGGTVVHGAGAPDNAYASGVSKTVIFSDGYPAMESVPDATTEKYYHQFRWEHFCLCASTGTGTGQNWAEDTTSTAQNGLWLGIGSNFIDNVAAGEVENDGVGGFQVNNVCIQDFAGNGVMCYKLFGKFVMNSVFIRRCAGQGSHAEDTGDMRYAAINVSNSTVDCRFRDVHAYGAGYDSANALFRGGVGVAGMNQRGTGMKIGAVETDVTGNGQLWDPGSYHIFSGCHFEGFVHPFNIQSTKLTFINDCNFRGPSAGTGVCYIGVGSNGENDVRVIMGANKFFDVVTLNVTHGLVDLGQLYNQDQGVTLAVHYWTGCMYSGFGKGSTGNGSSKHTIAFHPEGDPSTMAGGSASRPVTGMLPMMATDAEPASRDNNLLPPFAATDAGALVGWSAESGAVTATKRWSARVKNDGTDNGHLRYSLTGLVVGQVYSLEFYVDMLATSHFLSAITFAVRTAAGVDLIRRALGTAVAGDGTRAYRLINVRATSTALDVEWINTDANNLQIDNVVFTPGLLRPNHAALSPNTWSAFGAGHIPCI